MDTSDNLEPQKECTMAKKQDPEKIVREIKRKTRRNFSSEENIRIVLEGLRGEETIGPDPRNRGQSD